MKTFLAKPLLLIFASLFVFACAEDDDPVATPVLEPDPGIVSARHPVAQVLEGNYWQEKICFTYKKIGPEADTVLVTDDILQQTSTGSSYFNLRLDKFYVDPNTKKLRAFDYGNSYVGNWYYQNKYRLDYLDREYIRIFAEDELSVFFGAAFNIDLRVATCTDNEIILDGPIKPYIWQNWNLDNKSEYMGIMYLGIRIYWTKIENGAELLEPSNPLD